MKFCGSCGEKRVEDIKYCSICGEIFEQVNASKNKIDMKSIGMKIAWEERNIRMVGQFIQGNLFLLGSLNLVLFIILSMAPIYGWLVLLLTIVAIYIYPLVTGKLETTINAKIKERMFPSLPTSDTTNPIKEQPVQAFEQNDKHSSTAPLNEAVESVHVTENINMFDEVANTTAGQLDNTELSIPKKSSEMLEYEFDEEADNYRNYQAPKAKKQNWLKTIIFAIILILSVTVFLSITSGNFLTGAFGSLGLLWIVIIAVYFIPTLISNGSAKIAIFFANLFFGWTLLGWLICMIWAFNNNGQTKANEIMMAKIDLDAKNRMAIERQFREQEERLREMRNQSK